MTVTYLLLTLITLFAIVFVIFYKLSGKKSWFFKLNNTDEGKLDQVLGLVNIGDEGRCLSRLGPIGKAMIADKEYEVTSNGGYIEEKSLIKVVGVFKNKITVAKID